MKVLPTKFNTALFRLFMLGTVCALFNFGAAAQNEQFSVNESPLARPTSPVMDYAGVLDAATKAEIERKIIAFRDSTNPRVELGVAIVKTTGERPISDYSLAVARGWGIGSKQDDNPSALLFIAIDDRKYFTQVSKDLEDELRDGIVGQLQRQNLVPAFKAGNYSKGVSDTIDAFIKTIGERRSNPDAAAVAPIDAARSEEALPSCSRIMCIVIIFILIMIIFSRRNPPGGGGRGGRNRSGGGFGMPIFIPTGNWGGSSSGGWGGSSGGSSGWGGFGGGGDFGGGGAGGDW